MRISVWSSDVCSSDLLNLRLTQPDALIDIARVAELRRAEERPSSIVLGAAVRPAEIADGLVTDASNGLMRRTARGLAYRPVRHRGTLGGSLAPADPVRAWPHVPTAPHEVNLLTTHHG